MDQEFFCDNHLPTEISDNDGTITDEMLENCKIVFQVILDYCIILLEIKSVMKTSKTGCSDDEYCILRYNSIGSREVVYNGCYDDCLDFAKPMEKLDTKNSTEEFIISRSDIVAFQNFAIQLLRWLTEFSCGSAKIRTIICDIVTLASNISNSSLWRILIYQHQWSTARQTWHKLITSLVIRNDENSRKFADKFTRIFQENLSSSPLLETFYNNTNLVSRLCDQIFKGKYKLDFGFHILIRSTTQHNHDLIFCNCFFSQSRQWLAIL